MRIFHLLNHRTQYNGMVHAAVDLACAQVALGHDVTFCSAAGDFDALLVAHNVTIINLRREVGGKSLLLSGVDIWRALRRAKPDVVHVHMVVAALLAWPMAKLLRIPFVTCVQNSFSKFSIGMRVGDRVITGCQAVADDMARRGIPVRIIRPILNGTIGSARQSAFAEPAVQELELRKAAALIKRPAVVTACGLHYRKGIPDLIAGFASALERFPALNLYIFGGGPGEAEYKALAASVAPDNIHFCGQTPILKPYFEAADVFVLASIADPAPLVICEAREAHLAMIGTSVDGIPELLERGEAGILVAPHSPAQIAESLGKLFDDAEVLAAWKKNSQVRIDRLTVTRVAQQTVAVYQECLPKTGKP